MIWSKSLKALAIVFFVSGLYDTFGGFYYSFLIGMGKSINNPRRTNSMLSSLHRSCSALHTYSSCPLSTFDGISLM